MRFMDWIEDVLDMLYPRICPGCGMPLRRKERLICLYCLMKLPKTEFESRTGNPAESIFRGRVNITQANAFLYFNKSGLSQRLMHDLKYGGNKELGKLLGKYFAVELLKDKGFLRPDIITSVPLHREKLKQRGYNQSEFIALGIAERLSIPYRNDLLVRLSNNSSQTKRKRYERRENLQGNFEVKAPRAIENTHIVVVDDVLTTGATIEACIEAFGSIGNVRVGVLVLCIAIR